MANNEKNLVIRDAKIIFRNFQGAEQKYNRAGDRNFCLVIPTEDMAKMLANDGWKIKCWSTEDGDNVYYLPVSVGYKFKDPVVMMITRHNKERLTEDTIGLLDDADIIRADVAVRPYAWEVNGQSGIKAYLKTLYVTVEEDEFADEYADNYEE